MSYATCPYGMIDGGRQLRGSKEFDAVFKGNEYRVSSSAFLFLARKNQLSNCRLGLVIGKKNVKLATQRNRVKRALREQFRHTFSDCVVPVDLVVVARKGIQTRDKKMLNHQVQALMTKLLSKITQNASTNGRLTEARHPNLDTD